MLRLFLIMVVMTFGLTATNAQIAVQIQNNSLDTLILTATDNAGTSASTVLNPTDFYNDFFPVVVFPVSWTADNVSGTCSFSGSVAGLVPGTSTRPILCSPGLINSATITVTPIPPFLTLVEIEFN